MNPFRSRKKSHDGGNGPPSRTSSEDVPAIPLSSRSRTFRRKKVQPLPKKEIDLSSVLPSSDDFRTSLLMPNLSARFSMLREQDDPNTKIGKANDDSVLFPKRISRLNLFGRDELADIAEVASLAGSFRPPFASGRSASYTSTDGYGTDDDTSHGGSMMSRSKHSQGNKFFGGRQKIYKIPLGASASAKNLNTISDRQQFSHNGMGKAVYDDDVAMSAFQALRDRERQEQSEHSEQDEREKDTAAQSSRRTSNDRRVSPPLPGYNHNRETCSSTASIPFTTRISTAATSIASQNASPLHDPIPTKMDSPIQGAASSKPSLPPASGPERTATKSKRMYGQGLDQQIHEQQSSAMNRLNSLQRQRGFVGTAVSKGVPQSRSATNLNERFQRSGPLYSSTNFRAGSPQPFTSVASLGGYDPGLNEMNEIPHTMDNLDHELRLGQSSPISPPMSAGLDHSTFIASLEPNDLGKATASGAFSKPRIQYSEQQYAQRQLQLQQGRETPPPLRAQSREDTRPDMSSRSRNDSLASVQSSHGSKTDQPGSPLNNQNLSMIPKAEGFGAGRMPVDDYKSMGGTFLAGFSGSESSHAGSEYGPTLDFPKSQSTAYLRTVPDPSGNVHDSHNSTYEQQQPEIPLSQLAEESEPIMTEPTVSTLAFSSAQVPPNTKEPPSDVDSPTLGPTTTAGLSGLIKSHLRNESNQSSIYPSTPPPAPIYRIDLHQNDDRPHHGHQIGETPDNKRDSRNGVRIGPNGITLKHDDHSSSEPLSQRAHQILEQAKQLMNGSSKGQQMLSPRGIDKVQQVLGGEAPRGSQESVVAASWQEQLRDHRHTRGGSTETQKEREDFASELASRRRRVQDNLKSYVDSDSRSASPIFGTHAKDLSQNKTAGTFGLLKKASRGSLVGKGENPPKAMKMLGFSGPISNEVSPPSLLTPGEKPVAFKGTLSVTVPLPSSVRPSLNSPVNPGLSSKDRSIGTEWRNKLQTHQISLPARQRDYSESDFAVEPHPRTTGYAVKSPAETFSHDKASGYRPNIHPSREYSRPQGVDFAQDRTMPPRSQSAMSRRSRSNSNNNSRRGPPRNFDPGSLISPQVQQHINYPTSIGRTPRASPVVPYTAHTTSPLPNSAPAHFASTTPTMVLAGAFPSNTRVTAARKRSVNKHDISDPMFINCTSSVITVDLPPDASLRNGMDSPDSFKPPLPPINPRRKQTQNTHNMLTTFGTNVSRNDLPHPSDSRLQYSSHHLQQGPDHGRSVIARTVTEPYDDRSTFSASEGDSRPMGQYRLRKTSSEGGNMAARARQQAMMEQSPAMPSTPVLGQEDNGLMF